MDTTDTQALGRIGPPLYMWPEQVLERNLTDQSDTKRGNSLYIIVTGEVAVMKVKASLIERIHLGHL
ncbi:MAG: hypothetical protein GKR94_28935 [Gammaproteobacteria bacterium]|nr:hypothetical protein [Gammaproteobacteria bacterium]